MKKILNEWRNFIKENNNNYLTLDESQISPKFLNVEINERVLSEEVDPQALSLKDLDQKPPEFFKKQLIDMKDVDKNTQKVQQRIKKDKELLNALLPIDFDIDDLGDAIDAKELGGVTDFYNWSVGIINSIFGSEIEDSSKQLERLKIKKDVIAKKIRNILISSYNPYQREIFRAISLFTGSKFEVIRNPEEFDETKAAVLQMVNDGIRDIFKPTKETYQKAKVILKKLSESEIKPVQTWRGYGLKEENGKYPGLKSYKIGGIIEIPNLSSFSIDREIAKKFAIQGINEDQWGILFYVPETFRGVDVDFLSQYEGAEKEIITKGKFKIKEMTYVSKDPKTIVFDSLTVIPFKNINDLKNHPKYSEDLKINGLIQITMEMLKE